MAGRVSSPVRSNQSSSSPKPLLGCPTQCRAPCSWGSPQILCCLPSAFILGAPCFWQAPLLLAPPHQPEVYHLQVSSSRVLVQRRENRDSVCLLLHHAPVPVGCCCCFGLRILLSSQYGRYSNAGSDRVNVRACTPWTALYTVS